MMLNACGLQECWRITPSSQDQMISAYTFDVYRGTIILTTKTSMKRSWITLLSTRSGSFRHLSAQHDWTRTLPRTGWLHLWFDSWPQSSMQQGKCLLSIFESLVFGDIYLWLYLLLDFVILKCLPINPLFAGGQHTMVLMTHQFFCMISLVWYNRIRLALLSGFLLLCISTYCCLERWRSN